ncbi:MAG: hypothetical protein E7347_04760 [Clostridiales bacterium]|nr:hypothetical protein [Clostridiales bacterium]
MKEFVMYEDWDKITFDIVKLNEETQQVYVAITKQGRISLIAYPLLEDKNGLYFEYGPFYKKIYIDDFEEVND